MPKFVQVFESPGDPPRQSQLPTATAVLMFLGLASGNLFAEQVLKTGPKAIAVSHPAGAEWRMGEELCISKSSTVVGCGPVTRTSKSWAIISVSGLQDRISVGDSVGRKGGGADARGSEAGVDEQLLGESDGADLLEPDPSDLAGGGESQRPRRRGRRRESLDETPLATGMVFGAMGGLNLAILSGDHITGLKRRTGFIGTLFSDLPLAPMFYFSPEFVFLQRGMIAEASGITATTKTDYIELGAFMKLKVGSPMIRGVVTAGFSLAYLVWGSLNMRTSASEKEIDIKDTLHKSDIVAKIGGGFEVPIGPGEAIVVMARIAPGLTKVNKSGDPAKHSGIEILAGGSVAF